MLAPMRTPPAARPVRACVVCDQPIPPRAQATTTRCRVCTTKKAQADFLLRLTVNQRINRHHPTGRGATSPSMPHRDDKGAG
jgi:predicted nucleic acid-binding Zn ribbon protein